MPGDEAECPLCGVVVEAFASGGHPTRPRADSWCQGCGSLERHRALWLYLRDRTDVLTAPLRLLHVAPENCIGERLQALPNLDYLSADLDPTRAMVGMDLTQIDLPDESFDVILVAHVLEHIADDHAAMAELRRVLRRGGKAILCVPISQGVTAEDLSITDPAERQRLYRQSDRVRMYGRDGVFEDRLRTAGFDVVSDPIIEDMAPELRRRYRLSFGISRTGQDRYEPIFCCTYGVPTVPGPPAMGPCVTTADGQVSVSWTAPDSDGRSPITGYVVTPIIGYYPLPPVTFGSTATTQKITGLTNSTTYRFKVAAINGVGTGPTSQASNAVTPTA